MSDFLSNFTKNSYDGKKKVTEETTKSVEQTTTESSEVASDEPESIPKATLESQSSSRNESRSDRHESPVSRYQTEETEFDPTYKKRQLRKYLLIGVGTLLAALVLFFVYYQLTHVKVPDFVNNDVSEVRSWGTEEGVAIKVEQEYSFDVAVNQVISQEIEQGKKIKKGNTLNIVASLGADPDEALALPDFSTLDMQAATDWIAENKAENISLIESFDDTVEAGKFIKQEAANTELDLADYRRRDRLSVYYSKGKEVFEKNIEVPDFKGKTVAEVTEWIKKNELKLKKVEDFSSDVEVDHVISQETAAGEKVAKQDEFVVHISVGKAITIPDFSYYTMEEASGIESTVPVVIKSIFNSEVGYGQFISQSEEAGTEYREGDKIPTVEVVYSQGRPYIKDIRGAMLEGDLPKYFFDEFQSKGAYIYYEVYYVDSAQPKGTVVEMSNYAEFLPLEATIYLGISLGNLAGSDDIPATGGETEETPEEVLPTAQTEEPVAVSEGEKGF